MARTLPYLKEDHENIPKVFKIAQSGGGAYNELYSNMEPNSAAAASTTNYRAKRQAKATVTKIDKSELNLNETVKNMNHPNSYQNVSGVISKKFKGMDNETPMQESRQKGCEQNDGM